LLNIYIVVEIISLNNLFTSSFVGASNVAAGFSLRFIKHHVG
jgi:hypothetical protein